MAAPDACTTVIEVAVSNAPAKQMKPELAQRLGRRSRDVAAVEEGSDLQSTEDVRRKAEERMRKAEEKRQAHLEGIKVKAITTRPGASRMFMNECNAAVRGEAKACDAANCGNAAPPAEGADKGVTSHRITTDSVCADQ